jgi:hypothetical protein
MYSTVNRILNFPCFNLDYLTSELTVTRLARVYCISILSLPAWHRHHFATEQATVLAMPYTSVWEMHCLNVKSGHRLSCLGVFHHFPQSLQTYARIVPSSGHNHFLPYLFKFIMHQPSYHSILQGVKYRQSNLKLYNLVIRPIVTHACETCVLKKQIEEKLLIF